MKQPLTGTERIYADIIMDRVRVLGYRFERRKLLAKVGEENDLEAIAGAPDAMLDGYAQDWGLKQ